MSLAVTVVAWLLAALLLVVGAAPSGRPRQGGAPGPGVVTGIGLLVPASRPWAAGLAVLMFLAYTLVHLGAMSQSRALRRPKGGRCGPEGGRP